MINLVEFWKKENFRRGPFVHSEDRETIERKSIAITKIDGHEAFVRHPTFSDQHDASLHVNLLPVPYQGNLAKADIFIVMLNPGLSVLDYQVQADRGHSDELRAILRQEFSGIRYPFLSLNPEFAWTGGFRWWEAKLRTIVSDISERYCNGRYDRALRFLSQRMACIEIMPYHSRRFGRRALLDLPSVGVARDFVCSLLPRAGSKEITVVVSRGIKAIGIKSHRLVNHDPKLVRNAPLNLGSVAGKAILRQISRSST